MSSPRLRNILRALPALSAALLLIMLLQPAAPRAGAQPGTAAAHTVFLPMVRGPLQGGGGGAPPPPPPAQARGGLFFNSPTKTASADVAADARGGLHAAAVAFTAGVEHPPAIYSYCPGPASACAAPSAWRSVSLGDQANEVQLALTPKGQPRLLIVADSSVWSGGKDYIYAECDTGCASASQWRLAHVLSTDGTATQDINNQRQPQRSFALDPQGRPRFVYQDRNYLHAEPDHYGAFYAWCDGGCADPASWQDVQIGNEINETYRRDAEIFNFSSLTFTAEGGPRLVARIFAFNPDGSDAPDGLYYMGCDGGCESRESWGRVFLLDTGSGSFPHPSWDLALTKGGAPRIALFTGGGQPNDVNRQLLYLWCDDACLDASSWGYNYVGLGDGSGQAADIELDGAGRPRVAWINSVGDLGYAWCNTACQSDAPQWQQKVVETEAQLRQARPQAIPPHCDSDVWEGLAPALALDSAGNPRIAYDVSVEARCYYDNTPRNPNDPLDSKFEPVWRNIRLVYFPA